MISVIVVDTCVFSTVIVSTVEISEVSFRSSSSSSDDDDSEDVVDLSSAGITGMFVSGISCSSGF